MNAHDFYTRRILGMDYRVWGAMLLISMLSVGLYGYKQIRYNTINELPCPADSIAVNGRKVEVVASCYLNRYTPFAIQSDHAATVEWNFRDGTTTVKGQVVNHKFIQEGTYRVTAMVNGRCTYEAAVAVVEDPFLSASQLKPVVEIFADPMRPAIGGSVKFYCVSDLPSIAAYEWRVLNTNEVQHVAEPAFTFKKGENYTIQLILNNNPAKIWSTVIQVTRDIPPMQETAENSVAGAGMPVDAGHLGKLVTAEVHPFNQNKDPQANTGAVNNQAANQPDTITKASPPKAPEVDPNAFRDLLQNVIDQEGKELEDLYEYLDYKASTMVEVNKDKSLIPLKEFCRNMSGKKKNRRKIESLGFKRDDKKSIQVIQVKVQENKGFWDRVNPFKK